MTKRTKFRMIFVSTVYILLRPASTWPHQGHHHDKDLKPGATTPQIQKKDPTGMISVREDYRQRVEPIFKKNCMDCHSAQTHYPWYYKIPGIKQMIDSDISEARGHLDFSEGYPFKSHATPLEDLDAIAESVQKGTMPPFSYRLMHTSLALTDGEKKTILDWAEKSKLLIK